MNLLNEHESQEDKRETERTGVKGELGDQSGARG